MNCYFCDSDNLVVTETSALACKECGYQQAYLDQVNERDYNSKTPMRAIKNKYNRPKSIKETLKDLQDEKTKRKPLPQESAQAIDLLQGFQKVLKMQVTALGKLYSKNRLGQPPDWLKPFKKAVGKLWFQFMI